ncbi:hypothetical protein PHSY_003279 [Pseudozyma hubeiensis SY62]|uniref:Uncharacterized protein n=1 Tax=Pseudozyma hubeiensis (strain SY62) TaxID=1305764 RepID=R9P2R2_PSEHS|nr:hypothetical protein PHSY_003279 [Pseudozyma hubeiensis SY62]GAC95703.1 hypothetical protein PHSY_003279 [Pseudozyma hubeiensis SY62]
MAATDTESDPLGTKPDRSSSSVSEGADPPSKLAATVEKPIFPLLRLPQEIVLRIFYHLYLEAVYMPHKSGERHRQRLANWFKFQLPYVHSLFHQLLMPALLPCVGIASRRVGSRHAGSETPLSDLVSYPALLAQLRHLSIDFDRLGHDVAHLDRARLGHAFLIIAMSSRQLETLELSDLVLIDDDDSTDLYKLDPYKSYSKAKPWQFDLTYSHLLQVLADIDIEEERHLIPRFKQAFEEQGMCFPRLKTALLMDGNGGISVKDYANLFLIPRELCNGQVNETQCNKSSTECTNLITACPALSHLTLVLWYDKLLIDPAWLDAMAHVRRHHDRLDTITLVSRRLRYEPRLLGAGVSLSQWFERDVLPVLRHAFWISWKHLMDVVIFILTLNDHEVSQAINTLWMPAYKRLREL